MAKDIKENRVLTKEDLDLWHRYIDGSMRISTAAPPRSIETERSLGKKLDLHGLTLDSAYQATREFLQKHSTAGTRDLVIVTGRRGNIRIELPSWCELTGLVSSCNPIMDSNGNYGSYRIILRRSKRG